jgi:NADH-quinone oxidoreductase subunit C
MSNEVVHNGQPLLEVTSASQGMFGASGSGDTSGFGGLATVVPVPAPSERPYGSYFDVLRFQILIHLGIRQLKK